MTSRVLLAEDEPHIIELLCFLLGRAGFAVDIEETGPGVLSRMAEGPPDVLILDVMLPGMNGFEVMRRLRSDPVGAEVPVVMLTAKGQREDREAAEKLNVDVFITKPFSNVELIETVQRLAHGRAA
ncbi:response regulator [Paralimibaculum aggregatum]|uniref:Response regulator n=1 Tax=Paralimibaculum aggregatum TaxID=3036245 RepID=A0ABQ6LJ10_9RHOB|nr:response regulator [Limibaculum sp. NKW23]GMG83268.1 response regulator [Limibaculum sp. NKW23]